MTLFVCISRRAVQPLLLSREDENRRQDMLCRGETIEVRSLGARVWKRDVESLLRRVFETDAMEAWTE